MEKNDRIILSNPSIRCFVYSPSYAANFYYFLPEFEYSTYGASHTYSRVRSLKVLIDKKILKTGATIRDCFPDFLEKTDTLEEVGNWLSIGNGYKSSYFRLTHVCRKSETNCLIPTWIYEWSEYDGDVGSFRIDISTEELIECIQDLLVDEWNSTYARRLKNSLKGYMRQELINDCPVLTEEQASFMESKINDILC